MNSRERNPLGLTVCSIASLAVCCFLALQCLFSWSRLSGVGLGLLLIALALVLATAACESINLVFRFSLASYTATALHLAIVLCLILIPTYLVVHAEQSSQGISGADVIWLCGFFAPPTLFFLNAARVHWRWRDAAANLRDPTLCPTCNYDLRATPTRCPECGTRSTLNRE